MSALVASFHVKAKDWSPGLALASAVLVFWGAMTVTVPSTSS
jgi:hypothetical protein